MTLIPMLIVNVTDILFGAVPGVQDFNNTLCFQAAIDYCYERGGGIVMVPNGVYFFQGPIYLKRGVSLVGDGVQFPFNTGCYINIASYPSAAIIILDANSCCRIENIGIVGLSNNAACVGIQLGNAATIEQVNYIEIRNVYIRNCNIGIKVDYAFDVLLERVVIASGYDGLYVSQGSLVKALGCTFFYNTNRQIHLRGGGGCSFDHCNIYAEWNHNHWSKYGVYFEEWIFNGHTYPAVNQVFKSCRFEGNGWRTVVPVLEPPITPQAEDTCQLYVNSCDNASFESCVFTNSGADIHAQLVKCRNVKFRACIHNKHIALSQTFYNIGADCERTFLEQPFGTDIYPNGEWKENPAEKILAENILDQGKNTRIDLPGFQILAPERIIGLADGTIGSAATATFPNTNLLRSSYLFDQSPWTLQGTAVLTAQAMDDVPYYELSRSGANDGFIQQEVSIGEEEVGYLLGLKLWAPAPTKFKLYAIYNNQEDAYVKEVIADAEPRWHLLRIPANTFEAESLVLRIYHSDATPGNVICLRDSELVIGSRFLGAIPNAHATATKSLPAELFFSERLGCRVQLFDAGRLNDLDHFLKHGAQIGHGQPSGVPYKKGDIIWVSDPEKFGYAGLICIFEGPPPLFVPFGHLPSKGDGAIMGSAHRTFDRINELRKSREFDEEPWYTNGPVELEWATPPGISKRQYIKMTAQDQFYPGNVQQEVELLSIGAVPRQFAVMMACETEALVNLSAAYFSESQLWPWHWQQCEVGPRASWYILQLEAPPAEATHLYVNIYAPYDLTPVYLGSAQVTPGEDFLGATPNPSAETYSLLPGDAGFSPRLQTPELELLDLPSGDAVHFLCGTGAPDASLGQNGNRYLRRDAVVGYPATFVKVAGAWKALDIVPV